MGQSRRVDTEKELSRFETHDQHFIDANLLIGLSVEWDSHNSASSYYFDAGSPEYVTSERVHGEARRVVEKCRRGTLQVAERVAEDFEVGEEYRLMNDLESFVNKHFDDLGSPIKRYITYRKEAFQTLARHPRDRDRKRIRNQISEDFKTPLAFLLKLKSENGVLEIWAQAPVDHSPVYPDLYNSLNQVMTNTADRDVLLDAYDFLDKTDVDGVLIATLDQNDFVEDRQTIEAVLETVKILDVLGLYRASNQDNGTIDKNV